jgi:serine/threonine-protein kinase
MGVVYRARDTLLERDVALKVLYGSGPNESAAAGEGSARMLREARAAAGLNHPNAVAIFDIGEESGAPYFTMELISGRTLRALIERKEAPLAERLRWLLDMAYALAAAHRRGLVHRDIKPENVMVRDDGVVKVLDFGIARTSASSEIDASAQTAVALPTLTLAGQSVGTPAYMAPEHLRGEAVDARADQFAWGAVAYEVLTGVSAWGAEDAIRAVAAILGSDPSPPSSHDAAIDAEVEAVVMRALAKARSERFPSMDALATALEHAIAGRATTERQELPRASKDWVVRGLFGLGAMIMLAAALMSARQPSPAHARAETHRTEPAASPTSEAMEAYRAALEAMHDGSMPDARRLLARATTIDPSFAAAHLRAAMLASQADTATRSHIQAATQFRSALDARENALLTAFGPLSSVPTDWQEAERRLEALAEQYPRDAEIAFAVGWARFNKRGDYREAVSAFEQALLIDPHHAGALSKIADSYLLSGDVARLRDAIDRCLAISPAATSCLAILALSAEVEGRCADELEAGRRLVALTPSQPNRYQSIANALFALGDEDGARRALEQKWERTSKDARPIEELRDRMNLAILHGDFRAADEFARVWSERVAASPDEWSHQQPFWYRSAILLESGRTTEAAALAEEYLRRFAGWSADDSLWSTSIYAHDVQLKAGTLNRASFNALRTTWLKREDARAERTGRTDKARWWFVAFARPATTAEDANTALGVLASFDPLRSPLNRGLSDEEPLGRTYLLANRLDDARRSLSRAANSCDGLELPIYWLGARFELGRTFEALGDTRAACTAYRRVLESWGGATPRSLTAASARARSAALRCAN